MADQHDGAVPVTKEELLRAMDEWGSAGFAVTDRSVEFLNYFLSQRAGAWHWRQLAGAQSSEPGPAA